MLLNCYHIVSKFRPNCYLDRDRPDFKDFLHNFLNFRYSKNSHILKKKRLSNPLNFFDTKPDFKKLLPRFSVKLFIGKLVYKARRIWCTPVDLARDAAAPHAARLILKLKAKEQIYLYRYLVFMYVLLILCYLYVICY